MFLTLNEVTHLNRTKLEQFLALRVPEGLYLDYKEALPDPFDKSAKREFLKDISAFANSAGGHLLIGCKEPSEKLSASDQIIGITSGDKTAQSLEQLVVTSIDPRVSGVKFVLVEIGNHKHCIVVHVPPSMARPHMVIHAGHRSFYARNSESSFPMTAHEIRQAVLQSAASIAETRETIVRRMAEIQERFGGETPVLFAQAVPLIAPEEQWDVFSPEFEEVVRGKDRRQALVSYCNLATGNAPRPTIEGIAARDDRTSPTWELEIHRTGYVSALILELQRESVGGLKRPILHSSYGDFFRGFCNVLDGCMKASKTDIPYILTAVHPNASGTQLWTDPKFGQKWTPYDRSKIQWPEHVRAPGESLDEIAEQFVSELFHAFGYREVRE